MPLIVPFDPAWVIGFVLATARIAAFAALSPILGRGIPATARLAFTFALALAVTQPVDTAMDVGTLVAATAVNVSIGAILGYFTGLVMHLFTTAGGIVDVISGLAVSTVFDPLQGDQGGVFSRLFHLTATTMFVAAGGLTLLVAGLAGSVRLLPLSGNMALAPALGAHLVRFAADVIRAGVELALPVMGVLLLVEMALGIAARFSPQANVFLLGLPAKILTAMIVVGASWTLFPDAMRFVHDAVEQMFGVVIAGMGGAP